MGWASLVIGILIIVLLVYRGPGMAGDAPKLAAYFADAPVASMNLLDDKYVFVFTIVVVNDGSSSGTRDWEVFYERGGTSIELPIQRRASNAAMGFGPYGSSAGLVIQPRELWNQSGGRSVGKKDAKLGYLLVERPQRETPVEGAIFTLRFKDMTGRQYETRSVPFQ